MILPGFPKPLIGRKGYSGPEFVGAFITNVASGSPTLQIPQGYSEGDLLIAIVLSGGSNFGAPTPEGWEMKLFGVSGSSLFSRIATNNEPPSYLFTSTGTSRKTGIMLAYRGASMIDVVGEDTVSTPALSVAKSINLTEPGAIIGFWAWASTGQPVALPPEMTLRTSWAGGLGPRAAVLDEPRAQAGPTGDRTFQWATTGGNKTARLISIR
ncbi:hypothetical protein [Devosia crocina]|uniref:hypothetical protein n=1 Tax=Devosia crocina TaxID=429728 RepID=UPI001114013F|nr:hypothetical protein [Devosia crocina]